MASIAAVRDILSDIESKSSEEKENNDCNCDSSSSQYVGHLRGSGAGSSNMAGTSAPVGGGSGFYHRGEISGTSSSLVVDVHLPPEERQQQQQQQQQQKLCKHSVSRFQRCYSDGSQAQSPNAKRKVRLIK